MKNIGRWMLIVAVAPSVAEAHLTSSGLGPFYDGLLHLLTSPEDLAAAIGLALLCGLRGANHGRRAFLIVPLAWLLGSFVGLVAMTPQNSDIVSASWLLVLGALIALDAKLPLAATTALGALLGLMHGYSNGSGMNLTLAVVLALLGLATAVATMTVLPAAIGVRFGGGWTRIAIRVAGSWIAASGLLLLGWSIRSA